MEAPRDDAPPPEFIPNENFEKVKKDFLTIRVEAIALFKKNGKITDDDRENWEKRYPDLAYRRPHLFYMAGDVVKTPDVSLALKMLDTIEDQVRTGDLSYEKSNRKLMSAVATDLKRPEILKWLPDDKDGSKRIVPKSLIKKS